MNGRDRSGVSGGDIGVVRTVDMDEWNERRLQMIGVKGRDIGVVQKKETEEWSKQHRQRSGVKGGE